MYTLDTVVVEADKTKNKFGDTITEQSYYRTGGDVKVITREEIDKRHYTDMTEAIKRIPGVTFVNPGYRGGEYGYSFFSNSMAINGDSRVVVLVDGRRVDNSTSEQFGGSNASGTKAMVDLNQLTNIENVEKTKSLRDRELLLMVQMQQVALSISLLVKVEPKTLVQLIYPRALGINMYII